MNSSRSHPNPLLVEYPWTEGIQKPRPWYRFMRRVCQLCTVLGVKLRVFNRHFEPATGGAIYISNHQSFMDPVLVSLSLQRPMNYMARDSLFRNPLFKMLIESLNAFPVTRGTADTGAIKEAVRRLKRGCQVTVFPEGTRTKDGKIGNFLPGVSILSKKASEWTVPVVIDGAFDVWPRTSLLPSPTGKIVVCYGEPIHKSEAAKYKGEEFVKHVRDKIISLQHQVRKNCGLDCFDY